MGKRSNFPRVDRDFYPTPIEPVLPLIPHLRAARVRIFAEPCAGDGSLIRHLEDHGLRCTYQGDIATGQDALAVEDFGGAPIITNPPWSRNVLHPMIKRFMQHAPFVWLLIDAAWPHIGKAAPYLPYCTDIISVARVRWIAGTTMSAMDDAAWYRFDRDHRAGPIFHAKRSAPTTRSALCGQCGNPYRPARSDARYCSNACRQRAHRERLSVTEPLLEARP